MRGTDGMVDMWVSKTHAARRASSSLALPTIERKEWIFFLVRSVKFIKSECRNSVVVCRNTTTPCLIKVYKA